MSSTLSPEDLVEAINNGQDISTVSGSNSSTVTVEHSQSTTRVVPSEKLKMETSADIPPVGAPPLLDFDGLDIKDPVELLLLLDENILNGSVKLHDWQIQFMIDFANPKHTKESPFQAAVQACNSSGKDKYIIAACAVWLCMRYQEVECPITSSSGNQLDNQTGAHIDRLCNKANAVFGPLWKINYRYYEFKHVGQLGQPAPSKLKLFATDEAGKAEGYHPIDAGKKMAIFTSETKSIPEEITSALERCTGFTHRVDASSPGLPAGYFYDTCMSGLPREEVDDIKSLLSTQSLLYKVTAYQCSHISNSEIERIASKLPGGKNSVVFKSSILAEFGTTDEMVVIPSSFVHKAVNNNITWIQEPFNTAGLDLSDGGAETVLVVRNGNKMIGLEAFRFEDSEDTINYLEEKFKLYELNKPNALIFGDYCGMGGPMLRSLKRRGWKNMRFIDSRNTASEPKTYANRGTELFFNVRKLMECSNRDTNLPKQGEIIIMNDKLLVTQLSTRYYKITTKNIHQLLSKLEQKAKGYPSPDRADGLNLAFWNYKSKRVETSISVPYEEEKEEEQSLRTKVIGDFDLNHWAYKERNKFQPDHVAEDNMAELREEISQYNKQRNNRNNLIGV